MYFKHGFTNPSRELFIFYIEECNTHIHSPFHCFSSKQTVFPLHPSFTSHPTLHFEYTHHYPPYFPHSLPIPLSYTKYPFPWIYSLYIENYTPRICMVSKQLTNTPIPCVGCMIRKYQNNSVKLFSTLIKR